MGTYCWRLFLYVKLLVLVALEEGVVSKLIQSVRTFYIYTTLGGVVIRVLNNIQSFSFCQTVFSLEVDFVLPLS